MELRLAVDRSLGRLARWLRLLGLDTAYEKDLSDRELLALADQGRMVVTRTRRIFNRLGPGRAVFITENAPRDQLGQAARKLDIGLDPDRAFTRCLSCNETVAPMPAAEARPLVPEYVALTQKTFSRCPKCGKIYWPGTHIPRGLEQGRKALSREGGRQKPNQDRGQAGENAARRRDHKEETHE